VPPFLGTLIRSCYNSVKYRLREAFIPEVSSVGLAVLAWFVTESNKIRVSDILGLQGRSKVTIVFNETHGASFSKRFS